MVTFVQSYSYNRPFDGSHNVEVALSENEFDTPDLDYVSQGQSGVVGVNPALQDEDSVMTLKTCLMSPLKRKLRPSPKD